MYSVAPHMLHESPRHDKQPVPEILNPKSPRSITPKNGPGSCVLPAVPHHGGHTASWSVGAGLSLFCPLALWKTAKHSVAPQKFDTPELPGIILNQKLWYPEMKAREIPPIPPGRAAPFGEAAPQHTSPPSKPVRSTDCARLTDTHPETMTSD